MLTSYMQEKNQQVAGNTIAHRDALPYLTLSYDLENYYSLLAHIAQDSEQRWILFIAPPGKPNVTFLQQAGIPKNRIITLPQNKIGNHTVLLKNALKSANYSTVVTWLNHCDKTLQEEIETLATQANSHCFICCAQ